MSKRLRRNVSELKMLNKASNKMKNKMIQEASKDTIAALCDCASNIIRGNVPLTTKQFKSLKPYHKHLKLLSKKSSPHKQRKKVLQTGGFLGTLLKPIAKLLLGGLFDN